MGLQSWPNENIRKGDVLISKNYLAEGEVRELNRLTVILLDILEDQMDIGRLKLMSEAAQLLDNQLQSMGRVVLRHGGSISMSDAQSHAERAYARFKTEQKAIRQQDAAKSIAEIKAEVEKLRKPRKA